MSGARLSTGVEGLDDVLHGGLIPRRSYMISGGPGTGKTILGLHYLTAGAEAGETCLFVDLEESEADVRANAEALGFDLTGVDFLDLSPDAAIFTEGRQYDIFSPDEVEGSQLSDRIVERVESLRPNRVFVDPLTQLRNLTVDEYQFRRQVMGFMQYLREQGATVVFTSQSSHQSLDDDLQFISDGMISLTNVWGGRRLSVEKFRGAASESGDHTVRITDHGIDVFPVLKPDSHHREYVTETISSGVPEIDELLHGGIERGVLTILSGPSGVGKTTLGTQFMKEAAGRGERSVIYSFEERLQTFLERSAAVNIPAEAMIERGTLSVEETKPLTQSPAEFAALVREEVEDRDARIVMVDGIDGYRLSIQGAEEDLERELKSLASYLKNMGVAVILVDSAESVTGEFHPTKSGVSYLADNIVFLRYLEVEGELHKAIGVLKKRTSDYQRSLREFEITRHGIKVGEPMTGLRGILSGAPEIESEDKSVANAPGY